MDNLKIDSEDFSRRNEFTKVYKLEDETYFEVRSTSPLHVKEDGKWVDAKSVSPPDKVKDVIGKCEKLIEKAEKVDSSKAKEETKTPEEPTTAAADNSAEEKKEVADDFAKKEQETSAKETTENRSPVVCGYTIETLNNQTYVTELTVTINNKSMYHRVFDYSTGDKEIYIYDSSLKLVSRKTIDDEYYSYIYNNGSVVVVSNESIGDNVISDPGFNNINANWDGNTSGGPSGSSVEVNYLSGGYNRAMLLCANSSGAAYSEQFIDYIMPGTDITVGEDFYFDSILKKDGIVGIEVRAYDSDLDTSTVLDTVIVDSSTYLEKQTCFKTIHLDENLSDELELYIRLISYQTGSNLLVDNAFCYFSES